MRNELMEEHGILFKCRFHIWLFPISPHAYVNCIKGCGKEFNECSNCRESVRYNVLCGFSKGVKNQKGIVK
jgi:hypothetical protein